MKKSLLNRKNAVVVILMVLVVVFCFMLGGCASIGEIVEVVEKMNEEDRIEQSKKEQEAMEEKLSNYLEELYNEYLLLGEDEILVKEFEKFLQEHFGDKERLLKCLERQKIYNDHRYEEYLQEKENLEADKSNFSKKKFEEKQEELWNEYLESKNHIQEYFIDEEEENLINAENDLKKLYAEYF